MFIKELALNDDAKVDVLPRNKEKYISFTKHILVDSDKENKNIYIKLRFSDSYQFMSSSINKLAQNLTNFKHIEKYFTNPEENKIMKKKGIFPYEYMDTWEKLEELQLPSIEQFNSKLNDSKITVNDYEHAQKVWKLFHCKTLREYSDLYLKVDVLLLADIFENFRSTCFKTYQLDPAHYYTAPGLSFDAMLKVTKVEIELLTDHTMLNFLQNSVRGGISQCSHRYAESNNEFSTTFDPSKPTSYLCYLDACNLYGWAMSQFLPISDFEWVTDCSELDICSVADNADIGYILDVDIDYPAVLHDDHNDLPFLPENLQPPGSKQSKLLTTLYDKRNYVLHYTNLKQAIKYGLVLRKINRAIQFRQKDWLKLYIDLNTKLRQAATNSFEKEFYKLMVNSIFGKTMENLFKRLCVKLIKTWNQSGKNYDARSLISKPNFHSCSVFDENLVAIQLNQTCVYYDKPLFIGFAILEISKTKMYDFYYSFIKNYYPKEDLGDRKT